MRFLGSKFTHNALAAGAPLRTPLRELKRSPRPDFRAASRQRKGKGGEEGGGKGKRDIGEGKEEGKGRGEGGKGEGGGTGGEGKFASLALGRIDAPV